MTAPGDVTASQHDAGYLTEFHRRRSVVRGELGVSRDPVIAAADLAHHLGGRRLAARWARGVLEALEGTS